MTQIGKSTTSTSYGVATGGFKEASQYTAPSNMTISQLFIYAKGSTVADRDFRFILHSDTSGAPGALLGSSLAFTVPLNAAAAWYSAPFQAGHQQGPSIQLTSGATYWLGWWTQTTPTGGGMGYDASSHGSKYKAETYHATNDPADPFGSSSFDDYLVCIYGLGCSLITQPRQPARNSLLRR